MTQSSPPCRIGGLIAGGRRCKLVTQENGETVAYDTGVHYQVSATQVALVVNRRLTNVAAGFG